MEAWTTIRYLNSQGMGIKAIGRYLKISRNTVRRALRGETPPKYVRPERGNPKLEPFKEEIELMVHEKRFIGTRIFKELRKRGYVGSRSALYLFLKKIKTDLGNNKVTERYETEPGIQGQFDWSPYTVPISGSLTRVVIFSLTLSYSRRKHYFASLDETQGSCFEAMEDGFWHFGGVPKEMLVDNARSFILNPRPGHFQWNPKFLEFCGYYRFKPVACKVGKARTKGKVERPFFYLEQHFIKGRSFRDFGHFCEELTRFEREELDQAVHSTTQERPIDRFEKEKHLLTSLPSGRFVSTKELFRKVSWDSLISFNGTRYSVPWPYAGKYVWIRPHQGAYLEVYSQKGNLIATHNIPKKKGLTVIDKNHYEGLRKKIPKTKVLLENLFLDIFPEENIFLERLLVQQKLNAAHHLRSILELASIYPREEIKRAFSLSLEYNSLSSSFIKGVLESNGKFKEVKAHRLSTLHDVPRLSVQRDLGFYQRLIT